MKLELNIYELGQALKKLEKEYGLNAIVKMNLSGGWMTMSGEAFIEKVPNMLLLGGKAKSNNIIDIRIKNDYDKGSTIKITGAKDKKFNLDLEPARYIELSPCNIESDNIKINEKESKLKIDKDIIFAIKASNEEVLNTIKPKK